MTRAEHLEWSKRRALDYLDRGEFLDGVWSMLSDMNTHPELAHHSGLLLFSTLCTLDDARYWVKGFR